MAKVETIYRTKIQAIAKSEWELEWTALYYEPGVLHSRYYPGVERRIG